MHKDDLKRVYQELVDAVNRRDLGALDQIFDADLINHGADPDEPRGAYHFKQIFSQFIAACPDLRVTIEDAIAEDDKLVVRWSDLGMHTGAPLLGVPATGKQIVLTGIDILRIRDGRIVERWGENDKLYLMETLGLI
jgi:predicted ester cyclase